MFLVPKKLLNTVGVQRTSTVDMEKFLDRSADGTPNAR
jgi:hypothetical protein